MLKIPKQIYFDEPTLTLYSQYAHQEGRSFASVVREALQAQSSKIKRATASVADGKPSLLKFYGAGKSPYKRRFSAKEERAAFYKAIAENAALEGL